MLSKESLYIIIFNIVNSFFFLLDPNPSLIFSACNRLIIGRQGVKARNSNLIQKAVHLRRWWARGEGDGTPLQYSCLENLMDGEAW